MTKNVIQILKDVINLCTDWSTTPIAFNFYLLYLKKKCYSNNCLFIM